MKFMLSWKIPPTTWQTTVVRFLETQAPPPAGVTLLGRWHTPSGSGFALLESNDAEAVFRYGAEWNAHLEHSIQVVVEDEGEARVLGELAS